MKEPIEDSHEDRLRQLELENLRLRAELEARKATSQTSEKAKRYFFQSTSRLVAGSNLKKSVRQLLDELPAGKVSKDTISDVLTHIVYRLTRVGTVALLVAAAPLLIMLVQTTLLNRQNEKLDTQNTLLGRQNDRLDQSINLEEGNRRSSLIFFMSNIMDRIDDEMKGNSRRSLSDPLIGRIVSLSQALRPYRYLENDSLTPRQLSPERGQLLFSLINSNLDKGTYDKIFANSNFNYADLREANFKDAYMKGAKLANSYFYKANFNRTNLEGADLSGAYLEEATFKATRMSGANLSTANLRKSRMEDIRAQNCNFANADLREIYLDGDFSGSYLEGVKVQDATITLVNLEGCYFQSLNWLDSLEHYNLKGLSALKDYFEPMQETRKTGFATDTVFVLRLDPKSPAMQIVSCSRVVENIIQSSPKLQKIKQLGEASGLSPALYPVSNPYGLEELGIKKDTTWRYRLSNDRDDIASTVMWLEFDPDAQKLWEIFPEGKPAAALGFDRRFLKDWEGVCGEER